MKPLDTASFEVKLVASFIWAVFFAKKAVTGRLTNWLLVLYADLSIIFFAFTLLPCVWVLRISPTLSLATAECVCLTAMFLAAKFSRIFGRNVVAVTSLWAPFVVSVFLVESDVRWMILGSGLLTKMPSVSSFWSEVRLSLEKAHLIVSL